MDLDIYEDSGHMENSTGVEKQRKTQFESVHDTCKIKMVVK